MVEVYKVLRVVGKVNVYLHSINATPLESGTLKEICRRLKMEAMLLYVTFGKLPELLSWGVMRAEVQKDLDKLLDSRSVIQH